MSQTRKKRILDDVKRARRRRTLTTTVIIAVLMTAVVIGIILLQRQTQVTDTLVGTPISSSMHGYLSGVSNNSLNAAINSQGITSLQQVAGTGLTSNGKPEFLYIGAEYCPYCAAERWSIIIALSKFGNFSGLTYMLSSSSDTPSNIPTFSFVHASYSSFYVAFVSVEVQDRNRNTLQAPTSDQQNLINQWDPGGAIPFIDVGGQYVIHPAPSSPTLHSGAQFDPGILVGQNWTQIGQQLDNPSNTVTQRINGAADTLISAICKVDNGLPTTVCSQSYAQIAITQAPMPPTQSPFTEQLNPIQTSDGIEAMVPEKAH
jgi:thiol-disulfide isomerase/thioredoxin